MGRYSESPRYNIVSVRISDEDLAELTRIRGDRSTSRVLQEALTGLIERERQQQLDEHIRAAGI